MPHSEGTAGAYSVQRPSGAESFQGGHMWAESCRDLREGRILCRGNGSSKARNEGQEPSVAKHRARWPSRGEAAGKCTGAVLTGPLEDSKTAAEAGIVKCITI